jgi:hypothetical protein
MPTLTDAELRIVAEIVIEMAKHRGRSFDKEAVGGTLGRAALIDPNFRERLADVYRQIEAHQVTKLPRRMLASISFRRLEREAEMVLSGWKPE